MDRTKRQHTVPRCYLEGWQDPATGNVWVFDKFTKRIFQSSVWNIAQEQYFYDVRPGVKNRSGATIDPQAIEKALAVIEGYFAKYLRLMLDGIKRGGIPRELQGMFAVQLAIQWMRTKEYRESILELSEKWMQASADDAVKHRFPELPKAEYPKVRLKEESIPLLHNQFFFNDDHWNELAEVFIRHHIWLAAVNNTSSPFYTSDHPFVRRAHVPNQKCGGIGIKSSGVELFMPLSPKYGLILLERGYHRHYEKFEGGLVEMEPEWVTAFNRLQVAQSYRQVFSSVNDFETARTVCAEDPSVCDPNRKRHEIMVTELGPERTRIETRILR